MKKYNLILTFRKEIIVGNSLATDEALSALNGIKVLRYNLIETDDIMVSINHYMDQFYENYPSFKDGTCEIIHNEVSE